MNFRNTTLSISLAALLGSALPAYALTPVQLTNNSAEDAFPQVQGDHVVWQSKVNNNWEIFYRDLKTGVTTQVTNNAVDDLAPQTDGNYIAWLGNAANPVVTFYSIASGTTSTVPAIGGVNNHSGVRIADGKIAWSAGGAQNEIYLYDIASGTTTNISNSAFQDIAPMINADTVAWSQLDGGDPAIEDDGEIRIMLYDIASGKVSQASSEYVWPESKLLNGSLSVSTKYDGSDRDVFVKYNRQLAQVTADGAEDNFVSMNGDTIVWVSGKGSASEIFSATFTHSDGDGVPDIFDNCVDTNNVDQLDSDGNGIGDACEATSPPRVGIGVEFSLDVWDSWSSGYCADIVVTNTTDKTVHYPYGVTFTLAENTQFTGSWSGDVQRNGDKVTVIFPSWTQNIEANSQALSNELFGFCASGNAEASDFRHYVPDFTQLQFEFRVHSQWDGGADWTAGYCGKVWVTYSGSEPYIPAPNGFSFNLSQSAQIAELWNESYTRDGENVTVDLPFSTSHLNQGQSVDIGTGICVDGEGLPYNMKVN